MAREATITQEQVNAAADAMRANGTKPTARAIRDQLGTGSMATVLKFLQVWHSGQVKPAAQDVTLPPMLTHALVDFIGQEVAKARAGLEADLATAQQTQADLIAESERQAATIEAQAKALDLAHAEKAELIGKLGQMETDLATARHEATQERQAAEATRTELAKAQLRLEAMHILEKENERLQSGLDAERTTRTDAERQAATAEAKAAGLADRLTDAQEHHQQGAANLAKSEGDRQRLASELSEIQKEARASSSQIGQLQGTVSTLQRQVEEQAAIIKSMAPTKPAKPAGKNAGKAPNNPLK